jgi:hypothetical protein
MRYLISPVVPNWNITYWVGPGARVAGVINWDLRP